MWNMSAGWMYTGMIRPEVPEPPEYAVVPMHWDGDEGIKLHLAVSQWNMLWEAAQFRRRFFDEDELPEEMARVADLGDVNVVFVPRSLSRYHEYAPLLHLLPRRVLERFGLPLVGRGQWPSSTVGELIDHDLPSDFEHRLARAWAWAVWPHLNSGSAMSAFSGDDPIRILAHNLDFWIPPVTAVIQDILRGLPEVDKGKKSGPVTLIDGSVLPGATTGNPRMGGDVWRGEAEAAETLAWTVEEADASGHLREILEAVRSNRVQEDFSARWSNAREDFERKIYRKRNKIRVRFVELTETTPVQAPSSDILGDVVTNDFLALLDIKQRQIVILFASGFRQHEIAEKLGYANHSAISKHLARIRRLAAEYFELN